MAYAQLSETSIKSLPLLHKGKVRDIYEVDDKHLLIVTTDRLSAFDVVMNEPIPYKGFVLTQMADFWFQKLSYVVANHLSGIAPESVVSENGTAPSAAIPGYRVAGKTGTAQRFNEGCKCYAGYTASFIGFAPADSPEYVVSVTIQDPVGMHWGGVLGGPVFKKVMSFTLQNKGIAPTTGTLQTYPLTEKDLNKVLVKQ